MPRLTVSMDKGSINKAKRLARDSGMSVSALFRKLILCEFMEQIQGIPLGPITRRAMGLAKLPPGKDYKELLEEAIWEKYGYGIKKHRRASSR
jgi:hypothetical protein